MLKRKLCAVVRVLENVRIILQERVVAFVSSRFFREEFGGAAKRVNRVFSDIRPIRCGFPESRVTDSDAAKYVLAQCAFAAFDRFRLRYAME